MALLDYLQQHFLFFLNERGRGTIRRRDFRQGPLFLFCAWLKYVTVSLTFLKREERIFQIHKRHCVGFQQQCRDRGERCFIKDLCQNHGTKQKYNKKFFRSPNEHVLSITC